MGTLLDAASVSSRGRIAWAAAALCAAAIAFVSLQPRVHNRHHRWHHHENINLVQHCVDDTFITVTHVPTYY